MFFKLKFGVPGLSIFEDFNIDRLGPEESATVIIRKKTDADKSDAPYSVVFECILEKEPTKRAKPTFEALWEYRLPEDCFNDKLDETFLEKYKNQGNLKDLDFPLTVLSNPAQDFLKTVSKEITVYLNNIISSLCWRYNVKAPTSSYVSRWEWSLDQQRWIPAPVNFIFSGDFQHYIHSAFAYDIRHIIKNEEYEPIGHELFREAWSLKTSNPRSALVIGCAALEAGVKKFISKQNPDSQWLIENMPSPPIYAMIRDYIFTLPLRNVGDAGIGRLPKDDIDVLQKWILKRNEQVHGKAPEIRTEGLRDFLLLVRDILYLCDYYSGVDWAIYNVSRQMKERLVY